MMLATPTIITACKGMLDQILTRVWRGGGRGWEVWEYPEVKHNTPNDNKQIKNKI
jgi:hypothetical protein